VCRPGDHEESVLPIRIYPGGHKGELSFQTRPPLPYTLAAPESQGALVYVVYMVGGDHVDYQFFNEPPKEVPHGYACAYIPDNSNVVHSIQQVAGGLSGMDDDKQAWLAKYATRPSHDNTYSAPGAQTTDQISAILRDQFGILPKMRMIGYTKPYPSDYDLIPLPPKYRLPEFTQFNGSEGSSSIKHVSQYLALLGMILVSDPLRVRFFLAVSHRASFRMVYFTGPGLDPYMEVARGAVSHPILVGSC
jgi:hypothetical protein